MPRFPDDSYESLSNSDHTRCNPVTIAGCKTYARWWLLAAPVVIGKELFTYFIRVDGAPTYSFITALSGGILNIVLDYILVGQMQMGIYGAALATILGLVLSFSMEFIILSINKSIFHLPCITYPYGKPCIVC